MTTANDILALLKQRYSDPLRYACAAEVRSSTGTYDRRFDFIAVNCWPSDGLKIEVFEIKISKSDLKHELEHPEKHNWAFSEIDTYWLVAPEDIVDIDILPKKWGVMVVRNGELFVKRKPIPLHDDAQHFDVIKRNFAISLIRAISSASLEKRLLWEEIKATKEQAYKDGFSAAIKEVGNARIDTEKYLWMSEFCRRLRIDSEEEYKGKLEEIESLQYLKNNLKSLKSSMNFVVKHAKELDAQVAKAVKEFDAASPLPPKEVCF